MPRKLILLAAALSVLAAACAPPIDEFRPEDTAPEGPRFLPEAVDVRENAGVGLGLAVNAQGAPNISYFRVDERERIPPAPIPADPQALPAVMVASLRDNLWVRDIVAQESARGAHEADVAAAEAAGVEPPERPDFPDDALPAKFADLQPDDNTDVAVDGAGDRHVAWTNGHAAVQYATDAGLGFASGQEDPLETVFEGNDLFGVSIAVTEDGTPWIAFLDGDIPMLATKSGDDWDVERQAALGGVDEGSRSDIAIGPDGPVAAFGGTSEARLVGVGATAGEPQTVAEAALGISLALDEGQPVIAYVTEDGTVKAGGETVAEKVEPLAVPSPSPAPANSPGSSPAPEAAQPPPPSTGIAVDEDGNTWVAWNDATGVRYASSDDDFDSREMPAGLSGVDPHLAAGADGPVAAWYSFDVTSLTGATFTDEEPALAVPSPPAPIGGGSARCQPEGDGTQLTITAPVGASSSGFDTDCLATLPNQAATVTFVNEDEGVGHNWSLYTDDTLEELLAGPGDTSDFITGVDETDYAVDPLDVGQYFFQCDLHPASMTGNLLVVEGEGGGGGGGGEASPEASPTG